MKNIFPLLVLSVLLSACGSWRNPIERISPHKIPVQQGNAIAQEQLAKLKPGMSPSQVRFVLGTPLLVDPFRNDRWDYVYRLEEGNKPVQQRRITVVFEEGVLKGIDGDIQPAAPKEAAAGVKDEVKK
jgi:outer membrane protein assembly factor BamE